MALPTVQGGQDMNQTYTLSITITYKNGSSFTESYQPQTLTSITNTIYKVHARCAKESNIQDVQYDISAIK